MQKTVLPVAILGAGPVGLAAAAHLLGRGETPVILEAGPSVGTAILQWGHVRLFSPWRYLIDPQADVLLRASGWHFPDPEGYPTGREFVEQYLFPLAALPQIQSHLRLNTRVVAVTRAGFDKMKTPGRDQVPFALRVVTPDGQEHDVLARAVIDATGTYGQPNSLGAHGIMARGERRERDALFYGIPDVLGKERARYAGRRVLVVGSGHSAFNAILELSTLAQEVPSTQIVWALRRHETGTLFGGGDGDELPARGRLGQRVQDLIGEQRLSLVTGVQIHALSHTSQGIVIEGEEERIGPLDEIIVTTGFRPDLSLLQELRIALDATVESPVALAPLIDPNLHSCGTVPPHGVDELSHPEANVYIVGMKSYGRAPTFLMLTGYEQVRSIVAALVDDWEAARHVELVLPETGVCSADGGSCCAPAAPVLVTLGVTRRR